MIAGKATALATATLAATSAVTATAADKRKQQAARPLCVCAIPKRMWDNRLDNELVAQWRASIVLRPGETLRVLLRLRHWRSSRAKRSQSKGLERRNTNSGDSEFDQNTLTTATSRRDVDCDCDCNERKQHAIYSYYTAPGVPSLQHSLSAGALFLQHSLPADAPSVQHSISSILSPSLLHGELLLCTLRQKRKQVELQAVNKPKA